MEDMNIYYNPEKFGLVVFDEVDYNDHSREPFGFDLRVVWKCETTGRLYSCCDAGRSDCEPFWFVDSVEEDLEVVTQHNLASLISEVRERAIDPREGQEFIRKIEMQLLSR
jgi:predicted metal-binding protein